MFDFWKDSYLRWDGFVRRWTRMYWVNIGIAVLWTVCMALGFVAPWFVLFVGCHTALALFANSMRRDAESNRSYSEARMWESIPK